MSGTLVVGFGMTGRAVAEALGAGVVVIEDRPAPDASARAAALGASLVVAPEGSVLADLVAGADQVVPSPGVPPEHPVYRLALDAGVPVRSEIELAWQRLATRRSAGGPVPLLVAITGTNGKTTVATWVAGILAEAGRRAVLAGNIGYPLITAVESDADVIVAEVSSFQLQFTESFRPAVSAWLNLSEDHLDWHPTMAAYQAAKGQIWAHQRRGDTAVVSAADPTVWAAASSVPPGVRRVTFGGGNFSEYGHELRGPNGTRFMDVAELPRALPHDRLNAQAAAAISWSAGADLDACRRGLARASALPHRVALVGSADGVTWYDDSKATTPASVVAAVAGFESVVLIAGGRNKGLDLSVLASLAPPVRAVVGIGEAGAELVAAFGTFPSATATNMAAAVAAAAEMARPGDAVLLSPGCASFDWYRSYAERGDHFAALVRRRLGDSELEKGSRR